MKFAFRRSRYEDISGQRFGRLTVMWPAARGKNYRIYLMCSCECGNYLPVLKRSLTSGDNTTSCGCHKLELLAESSTSHGLSRSPEYRAYAQAKDRCTNPKCKVWKYYGGRGIEFKFDSFEEFLAAAGRRPSPKHSIDRINNDSHYQPGNLRWATAEEQVHNRRPRTRTA